ncbi:AAA family ATPase, partial [Patescibacteria group bacterium]|nr:AAA family ATPase [Patescibacteria group bacterium]
MARITSLEVENMYRIKAVTLKFSKENGVFIIGGRNEQGKSSTIDSLWSVLKGKGALKKEPVHSGAEEGHTTLTLDTGLIVTRRVRPGGWTDIVVENEEGATFKSPQTLLSKLFGEYLDPVELSRMNDKELQGMLEQLAGLDYSALDKKRSELYVDRTAVNKEQKRLQATAEGMPKHEDAPEVETSVSELLEKMKVEQGKTADYELVTNELEAIKGKVEDEEVRASELRAELELIGVSLKNLAQKAVAFGEKLVGMPVGNEEEIQVKIDTAEEVNKKVRANADRSAKLLEARESKKESEQLTARIDDIDRQKAAMLADAKLPVDGLSFSDEGVLFNGIPIEQESTSGRLKIFTPMLISMLPVDGVRLLFIRDGNVLDDDNLKLIADMA